MRAAYPDREGFVERDGAKIAFEVYECAGRADVAAHPDLAGPSFSSLEVDDPLPLSALPRGDTYDPVGNGKSDRVFDGDRYGFGLRSTTLSRYSTRRAPPRRSPSACHAAAV